jgi:hypothetical protein
MKGIKGSLWDESVNATRVATAVWMAGNCTVSHICQWSRCWNLETFRKIYPRVQLLNSNIVNTLVILQIC